MSQLGDDEEGKPFLEQHLGHVRSSQCRFCACEHTPRFRILGALPWILLASSWLVMTFLVFSTHECHFPQEGPSNATAASFDSNQAPKNSYFPTDFEPLRPYVEYETRTFTGVIDWNATTQTFFRDISTTEPQYFGLPNEDIDAAWDAIFDHEWTALLDDEVAPYLPELKSFNGAYWFEPSMYHSLHCLNEIRKRIDIEHYSQPEHDGVHIDQPDWDRVHIDHCLDQLRQSITCFGDLSPVPLYSWEGAPLGIGRGKEHTCRKWEPIRQWVDGRHALKKDSES